MATGSAAESTDSAAYAAQLRAAEEYNARNDELMQLLQQQRRDNANLQQQLQEARRGTPAPEGMQPPTGGVSGTTPAQSAGTTTGPVSADSFREATDREEEVSVVVATPCRCGRYDVDWDAHSRWSGHAPDRGIFYGGHTREDGKGIGGSWRSEDRI